MKMASGTRSTVRSGRRDSSPVGLFDSSIASQNSAPCENESNENLLLRIELARVQEEINAANHRRALEQEEAVLNRRKEEEKLEQAAHHRRLEERRLNHQLEVEMEQNRKDRVALDHRLKQSEWRLQPLPPFDENRETIDHFLEAFERQAKAAGLPEDQWVIRLNPLLTTGRAGEAYQRCLDSGIDDYEAVKEALLLHFSITPEGFRRRFRKLRPGEGESPSTFASRHPTVYDQ